MGRRVAWFLLLLFLFPSSSNPLNTPFSRSPSQNSLVSALKKDQNARSRGEVENAVNEIGMGEVIIRRVRLQGHGGGGHAGGGGGHSGGGGGGVMSHHNNDRNNPHGRRVNSSTTNNIGFIHLAFLVFFFLF